MEMNHAYSVRYAMTDFGPVGIRTYDKITSTRAKRIIKDTVLKLGTLEGTPVFQRWMTMLDTMGWNVCMIYDDVEKPR